MKRHYAGVGAGLCVSGFSAKLGVHPEDPLSWRSHLEGVAPAECLYAHPGGPGTQTQSLCHVGELAGLQA